MKISRMKGPVLFLLCQSFPSLEELQLDGGGGIKKNKKNKKITEEPKKGTRLPNTRCHLVATG